MNNIDLTWGTLFKLAGIAGAGVLAISQLSFTSGEWKGSIEVQVKQNGKGIEEIKGDIKEMRGDIKTLLARKN